MRILLVGQFKNWAIENHFARYLVNHAEVGIFPAEEIFDHFYHASSWNKVKFRLGLSRIYRSIATQLEKKVDEWKPDIVLIFKGMRILPEVITAVRNKGVFVANYNPDHPFIFSTRGSGNKNVSNAISLYDLHFCYSRLVMERIEREFSIPASFLPFGFELPGELYNDIAQEPEIMRACFIGNPDEIRASHVKYLASQGIPVDVYGYDWNKYLSHADNIGIHTVVLGAEFWRTMRRYRLQVNIFRPHNQGSHNMRTFEAPAAGAIMLAPESPEHREFFEPGKEIFLYRNLTELVERAKFILSLPPEAALRIREKARSRSLSAGFTYEDRARQLFQALSETVPADFSHVES